MHVQNLQESEEGIRSPRPGATYGCELPYGCWEQNPGPLDEQPVLSNAEHLSSSILGILLLVLVFSENLAI